MGKKMLKKIEIVNCCEECRFYEFRYATRTGRCNANKDTSKHVIMTKENSNDIIEIPDFCPLREKSFIINVEIRLGEK